MFFHSVPVQNIFQRERRLPQKFKNNFCIFLRRWHNNEIAVVQIKAGIAFLIHS
jgi:hypothetical protein